MSHPNVEAHGARWRVASTTTTTTTTTKRKKKRRTDTCHITCHVRSTAVIK